MERHPSLVLDFRHGRIRLNYISLDFLELPDYIRLLINPEDQRLCIQVSNPDDPRSHRISSQQQKKPVYYEFNSRQLLRQLNWCGFSGMDRNYKIPGMLMKDQQMLVFELKDAMCLTSGDGEGGERNKT